MLPKIASALARVLDPIKPIARPGQTLSLMKSAEGGDGGFGSLGYEGTEKKAESSSDGDEALVDEQSSESGSPAHPERRLSSVPFQPGLTQVIIDLNARRIERNSGAAAQTYETGAKDQKKNARLPKGSMLDKKAS